MNPRRKAALTLWLVQTEGRDNDGSSHGVSVAIDEDGKRIPTLEKQSPSMLSTSPDRVGLTRAERKLPPDESIEPTRRRELRQRDGAGPAKGCALELARRVEVE